MIGIQIQQILGIYSLLDVIEVATIIIAVYSFSRWAAASTINLISITHVYSALIAFTYYANLQILSTLLVAGAPLFALILFMLHSATIQKKFVKRKMRGSVTTDGLYWPEELIRAILKVLPSYKEIVCIIERDQDLDSFLRLPYTLYAPVQSTLIELILANTHREVTGSLMITNSGILKAAHFECITDTDQLWLSSVSLNPLWQQQALALTKKTDAVVLHVSAENHLFTIIMEEKIAENISAHQAISWVKQAALLTPLLDKERGKQFHAYK
jgi:DNA integrity scanning protein DisA with diadenylate cyclase activity